MKKKLTAMVTAVAMMVTLVPSAVFATEAAPQTTNVAASNETTSKNIEVNVFGFDNDPELDQLFVQVQGTGISRGDRIIGYVNGVTEPVLSDVITSQKVNNFKISKSSIPNINDIYSNNVLTIMIIHRNSQGGSDIIHSEDFQQTYVANAAEKVSFSLVDGTGTNDRVFKVKFDANYYPGENDYILIEGINAAGKKVGTDKRETINNYYLQNE